MPATRAEILAAVNLRRTPDAWQDGTDPTDQERLDIAVLIDYIDRRRAAEMADRSEPQRKAMVLLRSLLSPDQRRQLGRSGEFMAIAASGNVYRFRPKTGRVVQVTQHKTRWFVSTSYCIHDERDGPDAMPPADLTVAHLLMVLANEAEFLATANVTDRRDQLWNGEYLRRMRRRRELA